MSVNRRLGSAYVRFEPNTCHHLGICALTSAGDVLVRALSAEAAESVTRHLQGWPDRCRVWTTPTWPSHVLPPISSAVSPEFSAGIRGRVRGRAQVGSFEPPGAHLAWRVKNTAKSVPFKTIRTLPDGSELVMLRESDGMRTRRRRHHGDPHSERLPGTTARLVTCTVTARTRSGRTKPPPCGS